MDSNSLDNFENNKDVEDIDTNAKKLAALLLPKMSNQPKSKINYNEMEKKFYKTTGKGFYNNNLNKKKKLLSDKIYSANQKRGISNNINQKYYTSNNFYINNQRINNENNIIKLLQQKINEIENELEHNENTFTHNKKVMQKRLEEKDEEIKKLSKKLNEKAENTKKEHEISINNLKKNFMNQIKELTNENIKLKNKVEELTMKSDEDDEKIKELEEKNKKLNEEMNEVNKKYNLFITNDQKNVFEDDIKELIKKYDDKLTEDQNEINSLNEEMLYLNQENKKLKFLTKEIIEARNETEIFFLEALNEVKRDLYKIKKEKDKRGSFFPTLKKNYETNLIKVDIRTLTPEMRERVLRNLFEKINQGYDESKFRELNNIMAVDISDDEGGY
jgi:chromosome segregation ATPase